MRHDPILVFKSASVVKEDKYPPPVSCVGLQKILDALETSICAVGILVDYYRHILRTS
jgi:hypothetical protein